MPATAGRVRMPANNRVHSSAALQTHGIWQSAIGYDPYAPSKEESKGTQAKASVAEPEGGENSYASFQGLLALARVTNTNTDVARGACPKCGRVGHLKYQCRNFLSLKDEKEKELTGVPGLSGLDSVKGSGRKSNVKRIGDEEGLEEETETETESSDSDVDPEMERLIAERFRNKASKKGSVTNKRVDSESDSESDDSREKRKNKKRGRSVKRSVKRRGGSDSDEDESEHKKKKRERKKRCEPSDDEKERKRRHRKSMKEKRRRRSHKESESEDSDDSAVKKHKRRSKRADYTSDSESSDDARIGRRKKRSVKRSRKQYQKDDN